MSIYDQSEYDLAHEGGRFDDFFYSIGHGYDESDQEGTLDPPYFYSDNFGIASRTLNGDGVCYAMLFTEDESPESPLVAIEIDLC
jgi:hypothetical protein